VQPCGVIPEIGELGAGASLRDNPVYRVDQCWRVF
jgi:hypothetical protein